MLFTSLFRQLFDFFNKLGRRRIAAFGKMIANRCQMTADPPQSVQHIDKIRTPIETSRRTMTESRIMFGLQTQKLILRQILLVQQLLRQMLVSGRQNVDRHFETLSRQIIIPAKPLCIPFRKMTVVIRFLNHLMTEIPIEDRKSTRLNSSHEAIS